RSPYFLEDQAGHLVMLDKRLELLIRIARVFVGKNFTATCFWYFEEGTGKPVFVKGILSEKRSLALRRHKPFAFVLVQCVDAFQNIEQRVLPALVDHRQHLA